MSASPTPFTSLLVWLTVSVFLVAGGPASRLLKLPKAEPGVAVAAGELAKSLGAVDLARVQGTAVLPLLKGLELADAEASTMFSGPEDFPSRPLNVWSQAPVAGPRRTLVGIVELRI